MIKEASFSASVLATCEKEKVSGFKIYWNLLVCTFQTLAGYICLDLCVAISLHMVQKNDGPISVAGLGVAYTCVSILLTPLGFGFNQALNLHASQALGDSKPKLAKRYLTLNVYILFIFLVPLSGILYALKYPMSFTIPEDREDTSDEAWKFLLYMLPANIVALQFEGFKTFMIAYKVTYPFTFIHFVTTITHWFTCWLFVAKLEMGIAGAGLAVLLTELLNVLGLILFIMFTNLKNTVFEGVSFRYDGARLNRLAISYVKSSAQIVIHIYSEFFVFFLLSFIALSLGTNSMNAHLAFQNIAGTIFRFPISLSLAMMSFVGGEMSQGNISAAKQYIMASLVIFVCLNAFIIGMLAIFQDKVVQFYTDGNEGVETEFSKLLPWILYGIIVFNGLQGTLTGALKGIEKINLVTYSTLIAYYPICIPLVMVFTYDWGLGLGVSGIWEAFGISNLLMILLYIYSIIFIDWQDQSNMIKIRVGRQNKLNLNTNSQIQDVDNQTQLIK